MSFKQSWAPHSKKHTKRNHNSFIVPFHNSSMVSRAGKIWFRRRYEYHFLGISFIIILVHIVIIAILVILAGITSPVNGETCGNTGLSPEGICLELRCTEILSKACTWLREFSPCSCLTTMPCSAWVLLSTTYKPFSPLQADRIKGLPDIITPDNLTNPLNMSYWQPKRIFLYWKSWLSIWMAHLAIPAVSYFWESLYSAARL